MDWPTRVAVANLGGSLIHHLERRIVVRIRTSNRKVLGSTPDRSTPIFFSEYACVTFWNNTSFSFIHQAENIPSHLFQGLLLLLCEKEMQAGGNEMRNNQNRKKI